MGVPAQCQYCGYVGGIREYFFHECPAKERRAREKAEKAVDAAWDKESLDISKKDEKTDI